MTLRANHDERSAKPPPGWYTLIFIQYDGCRESIKRASNATIDLGSIAVLPRPSRRGSKAPQSPTSVGAITGPALECSESSTMRILVFGNAGSGKTTFARRLGAERGLAML